MKGAKHKKLITEDGISLALDLYEPACPKQCVIMAGALAVPKSYYAKFARWLCERGFAVVTFDLRGMGDSRPEAHLRSLRGFEADCKVWAERDFEAVVLWCRNHFSRLPIHVVGHSQGAHHPGMTSPRAQSVLSGMVAIGSGAGYWRDWAWRSRLIAPVLFYCIGPLLVRMYGYFPGAKLGLVGDLPKGVMQQWSLWCRNPDFSWGVEPQTIGIGYKRVKFPIHAFSLTDDEAMTAACTRKLLDAYANAPSQMEIIDPQALGIDAVGHLGFFRERFANSLWPQVLNRLESFEQAGSGPQCDPDLNGSTGIPKKLGAALLQKGAKA